MITLKIIEIKAHNKYILQDESQNRFDLFLEFYGIDNPKIGDAISFDKRLLDMDYEGFAQPYAFEIIKNAKEYDENKKVDYAILTKDGKQLPVRRIYG